YITRDFCLVFPFAGLNLLSLYEYAIDSAFADCFLRRLGASVCETQKSSWMRAVCLTARGLTPLFECYGFQVRYGGSP
ncbi:hypothetical protein ACQ1PQ_11040, partial [Ornithobacterium rhinotracheale]